MPVLRQAQVKFQPASRNRRNSVGRSSYCCNEISHASYEIRRSQKSLNSSRKRCHELSRAKFCSTVVVGGKMGKSRRWIRDIASSGAIHRLFVTSSECSNGV